MSIDLNGKLTVCKFDNDAATIRIFLKGLKNAYTIATKVYEKGPQTLAEAIKEVEKLQAAQQNHVYALTHLIGQHNVQR